MLTGAIFVILFAAAIFGYLVAIQDLPTAVLNLVEAAGLNGVEPAFSRLVAYDIFNKDKDWAQDARESAVGMCRQKLKRVSDALGSKEWLAGQFSIADIMMVTVLNNVRHTNLVAEYPSLAAYKARGEARPAYKRALEAQLADFKSDAPQAA